MRKYVGKCSECGGEVYGYGPRSDVLPEMTPPDECSWCGAIRREDVIQMRPKGWGVRRTIWDVSQDWKGGSGPRVADAHGVEIDYVTRFNESTGDVEQLLHNGSDFIRTADGAVARDRRMYACPLTVIPTQEFAEK